MFNDRHSGFPSSESGAEDGFRGRPHLGVRGGRRISQRFSIDAAYRILSEHRVTCPFLVPAALRRMRAAPPDPGEKFALRVVMTGGEVTPPEVLQWTHETLGATVNDIYGQTEANHIATGCSALFGTPAGAIGRLIAGRRARIADADGAEVPAGVSGEIVVWRDDPIVMLRYWNQPDDTTEKLGDGWIRTGDAGTIDEHGFLFFQGRLDDMIMASGYRLWGPKRWRAPCWHTTRPWRRGSSACPTQSAARSSRPASAAGSWVRRRSSRFPSFGHRVS